MDYGLTGDSSPLISIYRRIPDVAMPLGRNPPYPWKRMIRVKQVHPSSLFFGVAANQDVKCLSAISETSWLWHRRLGHMHMEHLKDISSKELVRGLPKIKFEKDKMNL
ncbi:hypothetical protein RJ640_010410 [Escallonia rubra]|uniref:GAG-pre-integrase domain-containing protein n=1 Tax=Escallonia rubra TaxID=112253 RepID=A0AA88R7T6_9ASTE|nr:hypothetical protein RJ640_010410 [Escallonia rubra]